MFFINCQFMLKITIENILLKAGLEAPLPGEVFVGEKKLREETTCGLPLLFLSISGYCR